MKFTIHTTPEDFYQFYKVNSKILTPILMKKTSLRILLLVFLITLILGFFCVFKFFGETCFVELNWLKSGLILFAISFMSFVILLGKSQHHSIYLMVDQSKIIVGVSEIELDDYGIHEKKQYLHSIFAWRLVSSLIKTDKHLFILFGPSIGIIMPLDQINTEIETTIQHHCLDITIQIYNQSRINQ